MPLDTLLQSVRQKRQLLFMVPWKQEGYMTPQAEPVSIRKQYLVYASINGHKLTGTLQESN